MSKINKYSLLVMLLCTFMISIPPAITLANSAEPPSLIILINNPPDDLSIELMSYGNEQNANLPISDVNQSKAHVQRAAWEGYYVLYSRYMQTSDEYTFKVTTNGESFECKISMPLQSYNNVFTLDLSNRELKPGKYPFRSVLIVSIRLLLTLLLEGIIFWLFRYTQKRSWLIFFVINLITQGTLNIWLNNKGGLIFTNYLIFSLIIGEFYVFMAEMIAFPIFIKEHKKSRSIIYAFIANLISLIAGGYIIMVLPI